MYNRAHPIMIVSNLWRVLYLSIVPVLRGFFFALQGGLARWLQSAWIDILLLIFMVAVAVLRWRRTRYLLSESVMRVETGLLMRKQADIPWERMVTVSVVQPFYLWPFRAVQLRADTLGGSYKDADISLLLSPAQANQIFEFCREVPPKQEPREYSPQPSSVLALSLLTSNSLAGILFISAFVSQSGKLLGREFSQSLLGTVENFARTVAFGVPPAAAVIAYVLLAGWAIGFLFTFTRYQNFAVSRRANTIAISGGIFTKREYNLRSQEINFLDIRQSVITKMLRLYSLYISAVGYGKQKDDISCIIPTEDEGDFSQIRERLFPELAPTPRAIAPNWRGLIRFIGEGIFFCAVVLAAMFFLRHIFPNWNGFILFVGIMSLAPAVFFLVVRCFEFATGGISFDGKNYTLRYSFGFSLHTVVVPAEKIVQIELKQGFFQKFGTSCDLLVSIKAENRSVHRVRALNKIELEKLFSEYNRT